MRLLVIAAMCILLAACAASQIRVATANQFKMGMSVQQVEEIANTRPKKIVTFTIPTAESENFSALVYELVMGGTSQDYYIVFRNDKLFYWGHPYEFNRHPDKELNMIGQAAVKAAE